MMAQIDNVHYIICIIFVQFFTVINAASWSYDFSRVSERLETPDRLKRSRSSRPEPRFEMKILDGSEEISVTWTEVNRFLVNQNLPVYVAKRSTSTGQPIHKKESMARLGNVILYHDTKLQSSAVYYAAKGEFKGSIGGTYEFSVPSNKLSQTLAVDGKFVKKYRHNSHGKKECNLDDDVEDSPASLASPLIHNGTKREINLTQLSVRSHRIRRGDPDFVSENGTQPIPLYIETLLFVTYDIAKPYIDRNLASSSTSIVSKYIRHFNAIDMIFASLPPTDFTLYINLAGVIIEQADGIFAEIVNNPQLKFEGDSLLDIGFLLDDFQQYINHKSFPFSRNSFDVMMISTGRELQFGLGSVFGWHQEVPDIFGDPMEDDPAVPIAIARMFSAISSHGFAAREIGKLLGIKRNDHYGAVKSDDEEQCYGVMQNSNYFCPRCMKWSYDSVIQLEGSTSESQNLCSFMNKPRSLDPPGSPRKSVAPCQQCICRGYCDFDQTTPDDCPLFISSEKCGVPLQCKFVDSENKTSSEPTILPLDGTPCGPNMVCWGGKCEAVKVKTN